MLKLSMTMADESTINTLEEQLRAAMLAGSVKALEALLADDLISIDHLGRRADKSRGTRGLPDGDFPQAGINSTSMTA